MVYDILFRTAAATLKTIAADPRHLGAEIGFIAVLHTWGQTLQYHPHLHCVVPGGGLTPDGEGWIACRPGFFLPVRVLSSLFRRLFLEALDAAFRAGELSFHASLGELAEPARFAQFLNAARSVSWVVYAKPPFGGPEQVFEYLGRYTHRVAISNSRLVRIEDGTVAFRWKDYRHHDRQKVMALEADEFLRRFLLHVLPDGFQRIRHYGLLGNRGRATRDGRGPGLAERTLSFARILNLPHGVARHPADTIHRPVTTGDGGRADRQELHGVLTRIIHEGGRRIRRAVGVAQALERT